MVMDLSDINIAEIKPALFFNSSFHIFVIYNKPGKGNDAHRGK